MAAVLLTHPDVLAGAVLFRPLSPFTHDLPLHLEGTPVLILEGAHDDRCSPGDGKRLSERRVRAGAVVTHVVLPVGHAITAGDRCEARAWLERTARASGSAGGTPPNRKG